MGRKIISGANGYHGRVFIGGSEICVTSWNLTETKEEFDVTNSCSAGFTQYETGIGMVQGNVEADYDIAVNPHQDPPAITAGKKIAAKLYVHAKAGVGLEDGPFWDFSEILINDFNLTVPAKGKVTYTFAFKSTNSYTRPATEGSSGA